MVSSRKNRVTVPEIFGRVTAGQPYTHKGPPFEARRLVCSGPGEITVKMKDGTDQPVLVFAGSNDFVSTQVVDAAGLTIDWYE